MQAYGRKQVLKPGILDLNAFIGSELPLLRTLVGGDVFLEAGLDPDLHQVRVDAGQIKQVLRNLVMNAREAMPRGGRITLATRNVVLDSPQKLPDVEVPAGPYCVLEVSDTGEGMEPQVLASIFDPFFTTKPFGMKFGLGLSSVHGIVRQCGGFIRVESRVGEGSCFRIFLPKSFPSQHRPAFGRG